MELLQNHAAWLQVLLLRCTHVHHAQITACISSR